MTRAALLALLLLALTASEASAKTLVTVKFVLTAYQQVFFDAAQTELIQKRAADRIIARLREHARFLDFTAQDSPFKLTVTLRPRLASERTETPPRAVPGEVVLQFNLEGPRVTAEPVYVVFRPASDIGRVPPVDGFIEEIDIKLPQEIYRGQLRSMLLKVPIANTAQVRTAGWLLPYERSELCLEVDSELDIEHLVRLTGGGTRRQKLSAIADGDVDGRILGSPAQAAEAKLQELAALPPSQVAVDLVWVTKYQDLTGCSRDFPR